MMVVPIISQLGFNGNCLGNEEILGKLRVESYLYNTNFIRRPHITAHYLGATERYDDGLDSRYYTIYDLETKIISRIPDYEHELYTDVRPIDSLTPVNLELSLVSKSGSDITPNSKNELWCSLPLAETPPYFADFRNKPITFWEKSIIDPNNNHNDPNNYTISFLADVREAIDKSDFYTSDGKTAQISLSNLNGEYGSQVPYGFYQVRFDVYPGNLNFGLDADGKVLDGIVNIKDLAILGNDWGKQGQPSEFVGDITGPQGLPDGKVDYQDLELSTRYWLKDIRDIMPSP
jgi:hypothetical protein